jgi:N-methylhydantoinase B
VGPSTEDVDPILLELLRNEIAAVTEEMAISISKTGRSPMLSAGDFATAVADSRGHVIGLQLPPGFICAFTRVLEGVLRKWEGRFHPGDVILCNDPHSGASHKPDVFVVMPVFLGEQLAGFSLAYSHHADVGGRFAGGISSKPASTFEEGIHLSAVKLYQQNVINEALADVLRTNVRAGDEFLADVEAKVAGCWRGAMAFVAILEKYGVEAVTACYDYLLDFQESAARRAFAAVPDGDYTAEMVLTEDGLGNTGLEYPIVVKLSFRGDELTVDFSGSAPQLPSAVNMPFTNTWSMVCESIYLMLGPSTPFNAGFARAIHVVAPPGTIVNAAFPAAVGGRSAVYFLVIESLYLALAKALPERVPAVTAGVDALLVSGTRDSGSAYSMMDIITGSWGARSDKDGVDAAMAMYFSAVSTERLESEIPVVIEEIDLVPDSGGAGKHRGGLSLVKQYRFLRDATVMVRTNRNAGGAFAVAGGRQGSEARNTVIRRDGTTEDLPRLSHMHVDLRAGDRLRHETGGQGGNGPAEQRPRELIRRDLQTGRISPEGAMRDYGLSEVELDAVTG